MKPANLLNLLLIPYQPEIKTKVFTPTSDNDSLRLLIKEETNDVSISACVGGSKDT